VLNEKPDVRTETADRVRMAIELLGYSPNAAARGLVNRRSRVIAIVVPDISSPSFPELSHGIISAAKAAGYAVMVCDTDHDEMVEDTIKLLQSKQVDGAILSFDSANRDEPIRLKQAEFPIVQIYRKSPELTGPTIAIDNVGSAYEATKHLIECGHTVIGHITTGNRTQSGAERLRGYREALEESHIPFREDLVRFGSHSFESGSRCMDSLLESDLNPTAVFAIHDLMAIGAYESVSSHGLSVPRDISVMGHDNIDLSHMVIPKLTTVDTFKFQLGQASVDLLLKRMDKQVTVASETIYPTKLVVRDSVQRIE
jgi:DNA-binding LacI/PurR family transcriptional regulator